MQALARAFTRLPRNARFTVLYWNRDKVSVLNSKGVENNTPPHKVRSQSKVVLLITAQEAVFETFSALLRAEVFLPLSKCLRIKDVLFLSSQD
jgi:hypothetical protein